MGSTQGKMTYKKKNIYEYAYTQGKTIHTSEYKNEAFLRSNRILILSSEIVNIKKYL